MYNNKKIALGFSAVISFWLQLAVAAHPVSHHSHRHHHHHRVVVKHVRHVHVERGCTHDCKETHAMLESLHARTLAFIGGSPVVTSLYVGQRSAFDGSDLIINLPSSNEDMRLLRQRKILEDRLITSGMAIPDYSVVDLSGKVDTIGFTKHSFIGKNTGDIDLAAAELDFTALLSRWLTGFIALSYDNSQITGMPRASNSRVFVNKAFLTVGNYNLSPFYLTVGQVFLPFGRYSSHMISAPLTLQLGRTKGRAVVLGFKEQSPNAFFAQAYYFKGDITRGDRDAGGFNGGLILENNWITGELGAGVISDISNSGGIQGGAGSFPGFASTSSSEFIAHRVPGVEAYANLSHGPYSTTVEFVGATRAYSPADMVFNGRGAVPSALNAELAYSFDFIGHPSSIAVGYGHSWDAFLIGLPRDTVRTAFTTSPFRSTILEFEYRHDRNYRVGTTAAGLSSSGGLIAQSTSGLGKTSDMFTTEFIFYF